MSHLRALIKQQVVSVAHPDQTVFHAAQVMSTKHIGSIIIMEHERLVGIFTERDLMTKVVSREYDPEQILLREAMTKNVITVTPYTTVDECFNLMKQIGCRHLPIVDDGRVLAVVSIRNVLNWTIEQLKYERDQLEHYIQS